MMNVKWNAMDVGYCESVQGVDRHATSRWESIWTAKSCEREERQLSCKACNQESERRKKLCRSSSSMGLCLALDKDLRDPWLTSDVGDENQLFGGWWRKSTPRTSRPCSQQVQQRHLFDASRSSREGVANACMKSTMCPKTNRL